jgi:aminoglycoside phosphotransferase (APT) family kinase protein
VPCRFKLSESGYDSFVSTTVELLQKLHREMKLKKVNDAVIARINETLLRHEVLDAVRGQCVFLHGDFSSRNILIRPNGEIVLIDWQNILYGPEDIDIYNFITYQKFDPVSIAGIGPEILRLALSIRWYAECIDRWLPWPDFYDSKIAKIDEQMCHVAANNGYAGMEVDFFQK